MEFKLANDTKILNNINENLPNAIRAMNAMGNYQWDLTYPLISDFERDINNKQLYVVLEDNIAQGVFVISTDFEKHYYVESNTFVYKQATDKIAYVHRIFTFKDSNVKGSEILKEIPKFFNGQFDAIHIDTNNKNIPMLKAIIKAGYEPRGQFSRPKEKPLCPNWTCFEYTCK